MEIALKYTVVDGDCLDKIATNLSKRKGITMQELMDANRVVPQ